MYLFGAHAHSIRKVHAIVFHATHENLFISYTFVLKTLDYIINVGGYSSADNNDDDNGATHEMLFPSAYFLFILSSSRLAWHYTLFKPQYWIIYKIHRNYEFEIGFTAVVCITSTHCLFRWLVGWLFGVRVCVFSFSSHTYGSLSFVSMLYFSFSLCFIPVELRVCVCMFAPSIDVAMKLSRVCTQSSACHVKKNVLLQMFCRCSHCCCCCYSCLLSSSLFLRWGKNVEEKNTNKYKKCCRFDYCLQLRQLIWTWLWIFFRMTLHLAHSTTQTFRYGF